MRANTADRAFVGLVAVAAVPYIALCLFGCGLLSYLVVRVAADGPSALTADTDLRPAAAFFAVLSTGGGLAVRSVWRQRRATRRLVGHVRADALPTTTAVYEASEHCGLGRRVDLVESAERWSFTYGLVSPRVAVSTGLAESADPTELEAVLQHERYHVRSLDPLKLVVARALASAFFFLPALAHLRRRYVAGRELAADRSALRTAGRRPLASALYQVVAGPDWPEMSTAAAVGGDDLMDLRITQLETGAEPGLGGVPPSALAWTGIGLALLLTALITTVLALGGPAELMDMTGGGSMVGRSGAAAVLGGIACGATWMLGGWALHRWFRGGRR